MVVWSVLAEVSAYLASSSSPDGPDYFFGLFKGPVDGLTSVFDVPTLTVTLFCTLLRAVKNRFPSTRQVLECSVLQEAANVFPAGENICKARPAGCQAGAIALGSSYNSCPLPLAIMSCFRLFFFHLLHSGQLVQPPNPCGPSGRSASLGLLKASSPDPKISVTRNLYLQTDTKGQSALILAEEIARNALLCSTD